MLKITTLMYNKFLEKNVRDSLFSEKFILSFNVGYL